jgi:KUP system potassium uptake protein
MLFVAAASLGWPARVIGAALQYWDGVITPAMSVLSAVEDLTVASAAFKPWVVPLTCIILVGIFAIQRRGMGNRSSIISG